MYYVMQYLYHRIKSNEIIILFYIFFSFILQLWKKVVAVWYKLKFVNRMFQPL